MQEAEAKSYEAVKREAADKVNEWFTQDQDHWRAKALEVAEACEAYEREAKTQGQGDKEAEEYDRQAREMKGLPPEPSDSRCSADAPGMFHPILACQGTPTKAGFKLPSFLDQSQAMLTYYTALIGLHDAAEGVVSISGEIWARRGLVQKVKSALDPLWGDKSGFIRSALRHVEAELAPKADNKAEKKTTDKELDRGSTPATCGEKTPSPAEVRAWQSYQWLFRERPDLIRKDGARHYTEQMYQAAMTSPSYLDEETEKPLAKPGRDSWTRYLRGYLEKTPKKADTRPDIRPEEVATEANIDQLSNVSSSFSPKP